MRAGVIPLLHAALGARDASVSGLAVALAVVAMVFVRGTFVLRARRGRVSRPADVAIFAAGWCALVVALVSPLHAASEVSFAAHMAQHELLMVVAAPLLILGRPHIAALWALPPAARRAVARVATSARWRSAWARVTRPFDAWLLHGVVIWLWHSPLLFEAAVRSELVHGLQHVSFLGSALVFWWSIVRPRRRAALGLSMLSLFTTAIHTGVLGALMAMARAPWYSAYAQADGWRGLSPLEDQQVAGLIMWIPANAVYLIAALLVLRRWLAPSEWRLAPSAHAMYTP